MTSINRRSALTALAVTASGTFLPRWLLADTGLLLPGADVCTLMPQTTEGPYYLNADLVRRDIRDGRKGHPLLLRMQAVDTACRPLPGARVDVWHCDAQGIYSSFGGDSGQVSGKDEVFLRGTQIADERGVVEFQTIYPGWYRGRTVHIHFKVWLNRREVMTGQVFFPDSVSDAIFGAVTAYDRGDARRTLNGRDGIARRATERAVAKVEQTGKGFLAQLVVGVEA